MYEKNIIKIIIYVLKDINIIVSLNEIGITFVYTFIIILPIANAYWLPGRAYLLSW